MHEGERLAVEVEADQKIKIEARRRDWKSKKRATVKEDHMVAGYIS